MPLRRRWIVAALSGGDRHALGAELREGARRVLRHDVRANARRDKAPVLLVVREAVEEL